LVDDPKVGAWDRANPGLDDGTPLAFAALLLRGSFIPCAAHLLKISKENACLIFEGVKPQRRRPTQANTRNNQPTHMAFTEIFTNFIRDYKKAQAKLPLVDQFDTGSNFSWALSRMGELCEEADRMNPQLASAMAEEKTAGVTEGKAAAMAEIAETHIPKTQHTELVTAAAEEAAKKGREAAAADFEAKIAAQAERC